MDNVIKTSATIAGKSTVKISKDQEISLIAQAKQGNEAAARELIEQHQTRLFAFIWRIVRNNDEAEDICQETFLRSMTSLDSFNAEYRFSTWIFTIGYRLALNYLKHRNHQKNTDIDFSNVARAGQKNQVEEIIQSEHAQKVREMIWQEVDDLSSSQKATILLFYRQGLSCQEISETLDMPVATVKSHMHRAREKLRERLRYQKIDGNDLEVLGA
jgi:RNA polymerase sigma-70 factor (ECF subfamily)